MQGYIIHINPSRDEDLIVTILTENAIKTAYRFYGARHSTINLGYKIDGELIHSPKSSIPQLRNILHLGNSWQFQRDRMFLWQNFTSLFYKHLKDIDEIDNFYFQLLDDMSDKMEKQNPKRLGIEAYINLLDFEGRLHKEQTCFLCETQIENETCLVRGFLQAHPKCVFSKGIDIENIKHLLNEKSTLFLNDDEIEILWKVLLEGF